MNKRHRLTCKPSLHICSTNSPRETEKAYLSCRRKNIYLSTEGPKCSDLKHYRQKIKNFKTKNSDGK